MEGATVINIKCQLKAKQLLECFDRNLKRLQEQGVDASGNESEADTIDLLSEWLEEAIENGARVEDLQDRAVHLAEFAFSRGYSRQEVEELLTMRPNPKGDRPW
ncbi:hypothetical protein [Thiomicrorhabdus xiamenensis]|uniref:Uncharacterized protein n=1 Tax=Thiomicrorhabdus xiamenensis TaxID=2739063 RepID=A0A7D4SM53_9GAMM|nr:hypothetical protein [Thiomicrorhabdus xiamenensis]QKI88161.1 hypothetical protein HQN79_00530 [Thiomicrorhabdus xiamenensis]